MALTVATWNVNSIRARIGPVADWFRARNPDIAVLQEIKCEDDDFPRLEFESLGYSIAVHGQKSYNGVALLSKTKPDHVRRRLPGDSSDEQARWIEGEFGQLVVCGLYLPNGNPPDTDKYVYKLDWMDRLKRRISDLLDEERPVVVLGDWNVIPEEHDAHDPAAWIGDALFLPRTRAKLREIVNLGYTDAFRALHPQRIAYTFWDYQGRAWQADNGIRIDHALLSPEAADRLLACDIDRDERAREKASDHVPVVVTFDL